ncbi:MAG: hypothetical protein KF862_07160 [Chitinophagaceae bacterium]|nr:hypothetical protein [Chitinophagaceae bacterium]
MIKLFYILSLIFLFSCRASKQNRTEDRHVYNNERVVAADSVNVRKDLSKIEQNNDKVDEGYIEVDLEFAPETDTAYEEPIKPAIVDSGDILGWLEVALSNPRIKSAKIKGKLLRTDNSKTTTQKNITDSAATKNVDSSWTKEEIVHVDEHKKTEQFSIWKLFPWYVWLIIIVVLASAGWYLYKTYFPNFLKPKKNENRI